MDDLLAFVIGKDGRHVLGPQHTEGAVLEPARNVLAVSAKRHRANLHANHGLLHHGPRAHVPQAQRAIVAARGKDVLFGMAGQRPQLSLGMALEKEN